MEYRVRATYCDGTKANLKKELLSSSEMIGLKKDLLSANTVFVKPNLTYPEYRKGVTTRKDFIESLVDVLITTKPDLKIYIGEGDGGYNSYSSDAAFENMGFYELESEYPQIKIVNLSKVPSQCVEIDTPRGIYKLLLPKIFFDEVDFSISCPVPKVHCMTKVTLSYKNQWGCLPDVMRLKNHYMFNYIISKVSDVLKFKYAFLDGKYGLNVNGPMIGEPLEVNWFVASNSLGAFDVVVSEMMGFKWRKVEHLKMAEKYGFIPAMKDIEIFGDIGALKTKFTLNRNMWNYPALAAFHSKWLTHLLYLSSWAKILHDVMYLFRKRPI